MALNQIIFLTSLFAVLVLLSTPCQASHIPDFENALDAILCQSVKRLPNHIIDIRKSIDKGADLIGGKWVKDVENCIADCCSTKGCEFALYKMSGKSTSGKNCYFINCGSDVSNCVKVEHNGFTSVLMASWDDSYGQEDETTSPQYTTTEDSTTSEPSSTTHESTPSPSDTSEQTPESDSTTSPIPTNTSALNSTDPIPMTSRPDGGQQLESKDGHQLEQEPKSKAGVENNQPVNVAPGNDSSGVIAIVIVGVICSLIVVIVVIALARKVMTDMRRKRFRNVDYLINGMYT